MTFTTLFLDVARAYCAAADVDMARASHRALGDGRRLVLVVAGEASLTLDRADRALQWFSDHWPDGADWPAAVARPSPAPVEALS